MSGADSTTGVPPTGRYEAHSLLIASDLSRSQGETDLRGMAVPAMTRLDARFPRLEALATGLMQV